MKKDPIQRRIDDRIKVKDAREDTRSRQINVSWAVNVAREIVQASVLRVWKFESVEDGLQLIDALIEKEARKTLHLFDKLFEERSQEQARRYEVEDEAKTAAELEAGDE